MSDVLTPAQRHKCMSNIHGRDTKPEMVVRLWLYHHGYRYRIQKADLPGKPDIVLKKYKLAIFVNGCYWHRHENCKYCTTPRTNSDFWQKKFNGNVKRDQDNYNKLIDMGWNILTIWECEVKNGSYEKKLTGILSENKCT